MTLAGLDDVGLILIGHGSKLPHNKENVEKLAEMLRNRYRFKAVETAFMEMNTPTIAEAIEALANKDVSKIVLVPAFLAAGVHTTRDIPGLLASNANDLRLKERGIELVYGEPIGFDERIALILEEKALHALEQAQETKIVAT